MPLVSFSCCTYLVQLFSSPGFRVGPPAGVGVPIQQVIDVMTKTTSTRRIRSVTGCRKKPNGESALYGACAPPFGFFWQLVTLFMRRGELVIVITSITCWIGTPTPAGGPTRKLGKKIAVQRYVQQKKKTAYCHCRESAQCNVRK